METNIFIFLKSIFSADVFRPLRGKLIVDFDCSLEVNKSLLTCLKNIRNVNVVNIEVGEKGQKDEYLQLGKVKILKIYVILVLLLLNSYDKYHNNKFFFLCTSAYVCKRQDVFFYI